jgi:hypothetical protein
VGAIDETNEAVDWQVLTWVEHAPDGTQPVQAQIQVMPVITNDAITPAEHIVIKVFIDARLPILGESGEMRQGGSVQLFGQEVLVYEPGYCGACLGRCPCSKGFLSGC